MTFEKIHLETEVSTRRHFMNTTVIGIVGAAAAGWWVYHRGVISDEKGDAFDVWKNWNTQDANKPLRLVRAGILAPSPRNSQPWAFRVEPWELDVFVDENRNMAAIDPFRQEMYMAAGAALENALLAAKKEGYAANVTILPDAELRHWAARVDLVEGPASTPDLYPMIPRRHTNRSAFDRSKAVPEAAMSEMSRLAAEPGPIEVVWLKEAAARERFADLTIKATQAMIADGDQNNDLAQWYRTTWSDVLATSDGITLDNSGITPARKVVGKIFLPPKPADLNAKWLENTRNVYVASTPMYGMLKVANPNDIPTAIQAGQAFQKMSLWATKNGLSIHPLTPSIERMNAEKSAGGEHVYTDALRELAGFGGDPIIAFRIGYATEPPIISPRRPLADVLPKDKPAKKKETPA